MDEELGPNNSEPAIPVEKLTYRASTDSPWPTIWRILAWVGIAIGALRMAGGMLVIWALYKTKAKGGTINYAAADDGFLWNLGADLAVLVCGGVVLLSGIMLLKGSRAGLPIMRIAEIGFVGVMLAALGRNLYYVFVQSQAYGSEDPGYWSYTISSQIIHVLVQLSFSAMVIPLLTLGMRHEDGSE